MKLRACVLLLTITSMASSVPITYKLLNAPGLVSMPVHDARARHIIDAHPASVRAVELEPYSIVVQNHTSETIIGYVVRTTLVDEAGVTRVKERIFHNLNLLPGGGVAPNGNEIGPRSTFIITPIDILPAVASQAVPRPQMRTNALKPDTLLAELNQQSAIVVSLDLVVYESGRFLGPDEGEVTSLLQAQLEAEKQIARIVTDNVSSRLPVAAITDLLNNRIPNSPRPRVAGAVAEYWQDVAMRNVVGFYLYKARISQEELERTALNALKRASISLHRGQ